MKFFQNKKGSFAVLALMIVVSLYIGICMIIKAAGGVAIGGAVENFGALWAKSILSEYDIALRNRYSILGFYGNKSSVENTLEEYIDYTFKSKEYIEYSTPDCSLDDYCLLNTQNIKRQIEMMSLESWLMKEEEESKGENTYREINANWIIENLPSYNKVEDSYILGIVDKIKEGLSLETILKNASIDNYIFNFFKDYMEDRGLGETYFRCEVEYIITGELSDIGAKVGSKNKLLLIRNLLNLSYLYTCPEKRDSAMALAASLTPGGAALITQAVILEAWAYAEAENDLKILYDEKTVPLLKNDSNWALSLENIANIEDDEAQSEESKGIDDAYVMPLDMEGINYSNYLAVLLCGVPEDTKLLRIMDLIQINMKYIYCDYFLLKDYYCGLSFDLEVNGNVYQFEDEYQ